MDLKHRPATQSRLVRRQPDSVQRARICVFENEQEIVILSAAAVATVIARIGGQLPVEVAPEIPLFWLSAEDRMRAVGDASWDSALRRIGYDLVAISFADWSEERVHFELRRTFPTIALLTPE